MFSPLVNRSPFPANFSFKAVTNFSLILSLCGEQQWLCYCMCNTCVLICFYVPSSKLLHVTLRHCFRYEWSRGCRQVLRLLCVYLPVQRMTVGKPVWRYWKIDAVTVQKDYINFRKQMAAVKVDAQVTQNLLWFAKASLAVMVFIS